MDNALTLLIVRFMRFVLGLRIVNDFWWMLHREVNFLTNKIQEYFIVVVPLFFQSVLRFNLHYPWDTWELLRLGLLFYLRKGKVCARGVSHFRIIIGLIFFDMSQLTFSPVMRNFFLKTFCVKFLASRNRLSCQKLRIFVGLKCSWRQKGISRNS